MYVCVCVCIKWSCTACTLYNPSSRSMCELCNAPRPAAANVKKKKVHTVLLLGADTQTTPLTCGLCQSSFIAMTLSLTLCVFWCCVFKKKFLMANSFWILFILFAKARTCGIFVCSCKRRKRKRLFKRLWFVKCLCLVECSWWPGFLGGSFW